MKKQEILIIPKLSIDNPVQTIWWTTYIEGDEYGAYVLIDYDTPRSAKIEAMELLLVQAMLAIEEIWGQQAPADGN